MLNKAITIEKTGERIHEGLYASNQSDYLISLFHSVSYEFAKTLIRGGSVLDYGCGYGHGVQRISGICKSIVGVDVFMPALLVASDMPSCGNPSFVCIPDTRECVLPFLDESFDAVVSFQVIEHIHNVDSYLSEIRRTLKRGGVAVFATPDRSTRLFRFQKPWNMWHVVEYDSSSLRKTIGQFFSDVKILTMSGTKSVLDIEYRRTRAMKWVTLPCTMPCIPDGIRRRCLSLMKAILNLFHRNGTVANKDFWFNESDLYVSENVDSGVNLLAIARK